MQVLYDNSRNGEILVQIESLDDLWLLYNLLKPGDRIKGRTVRRVVIREGDAGERKPMTLGIVVENVEFHEFTNRLRVLGTIYEGPDEWVSIGQHHTFNLEVGHKVRIFKDQWLKSEILRLKRSIQNKSERLMVLAIAIETGLANLALLSNYTLTPIAQIKQNIPGKRYKNQQAKSALKSFYKKITDMVKDNLQRLPIALIVIVGPGFTKEQYAEVLREELSDTDKKVDIRTANASTGEISGIYEVLRNGTISTLKKNFKIAQDELLMAKFIEHLSKEDNLAIYGLDQVYLAAQMGAIEHLLITDSLLRKNDQKIRQKVDETLLNTENNRGTVHILNTINPSGEQLKNFGEICAILRFRVNL